MANGGNGEAQLPNPLAALKVLEVSLDGIREVIAEIDQRHTERLADAQSQMDRRFDHVAGLSDTRLEALNKLIEQRFLDSARLVDQAMNAAKEAVGKAEVANEKRFDGVNEFRAQLGDILSGAMPRTEAEIRLTALSDKQDASHKEVMAKIETALSGWDRRFDALKEDLRQQMGANTSAIERSGGGSAATQRIVATTIAIIAALGSLGAVIAVVVHG